MSSLCVAVLEYSTLASCWASSFRYLSKGSKSGSEEPVGLNAFSLRKDVSRDGIAVPDFAAAI